MSDYCSDVFFLAVCSLQHSRLVKSWAHLAIHKALWKVLTQRGSINKEKGCSSPDDSIAPREYARYVLSDLSPKLRFENPTLVKGQEIH